MLSLPVWIKVKEYKKNPKGITCCDFRFSCFISSVRVCACVCVFVENLPGSSGSSKLPLVCFLKEAKGSGGYQPRGILGGLAVWQVCALASEELPWRRLVDSQWCALFCHAFCTCWSVRVKPDCVSRVSPCILHRLLPDFIWTVSLLLRVRERGNTESEQISERDVQRFHCNSFRLHTDSCMQMWRSTVVKSLHTLMR